MIQQYINGLSARGLIIKPLTEREFQTDHTIDNINFSIRTVISQDFPYCIPKFHLIDRYRYGALAHVAWGEDSFADICIGHDDHIIKNIDAPLEVLYDSLMLAIGTIEKALTDKEYNQSEIFREYIGVWRFHLSENLAKGIFIGNIPKTDEEISSVAEAPKSKFGTNSKIIFSAKNYQSDHFLAQARKTPKRSIIGKSFFLTINPNELIPPPEPRDKLIEWWRTQLSSLSQSQQKELKEQARKIKSKIFFLLIHITVNQKPALLALKFSNKIKERAPLFIDNEMNNWTVEAFHIDLITANNLLSRSGSSDDLINKKICLIGAGSVGGYISDLMCSSGIGFLDIYDTDDYLPENLHKHILPANYLYINKAQALQRFLTSKYPFITVNGVTKKGEYFLSEKTITKLVNYDLIILATGNATFERRFHQYCFTNDIKIPMIFSWVEALGVGGHSVVSIKDHKGCLECTYVGLETYQKSLINKLGFIAPNQKIIEAHVGCGTEFMPFSVTDAQLTANYASRLSLDVLYQHITEGTSISWKGNDTLANQQGIKLTYRYKKSAVHDYKSIYDPYCYLCNT